MDAKTIIKRLQKAGWELSRIKGSHHILKKEGMAPVTVPVHGKKDIKPGLLNAIEKATGVKLK
jgi:predicted RNA binding protein YcfA (HicA-like mRNA interferase family)